MDSPEWTAAKKLGDAGEKIVSNWFRERGWEPYFPMPGAPFDIMLQCLVEVKKDVKCEQTGNVAVEFSRDGEPSGIRTSTATWWLFVVNDLLYIGKRSELLRFVTKGKFRESPAGDRKATMVWLVPTTELKQCSSFKIIQLPTAAGKA